MMKNISILLTHHHRRPTPDARHPTSDPTPDPRPPTPDTRHPTRDPRPATRDTRHPTPDTRHPTPDPRPTRAAKRDVREVQSEFRRNERSTVRTEQCTNGALYERSNNKKVLVHTHIHIFTLPDNFALDLAGFLLPAVERHTRLVIALSDEIVFLACSEV